MGESFGKHKAICSSMSGRSPGGGHGNPLQYSFLENSMDREAWQATVHRVAKSRIRLKWPSMHAERITGSQDKLQTTDLYQKLDGLSTTKPSASFSDSPWTPFVLPSVSRVCSPEFSYWVCVLLKWSPEMSCNLPFFLLFYKWAKEALSVGPYIAYIFTTGWDLLAQKPASAKLNCLYIQLCKNSPNKQSFSQLGSACFVSPAESYSPSAGDR